MPDPNLEYYIKGLRGVFIFGGDIAPSDDPMHLEGLGWRSLKGLEPDKTGPMPSYERVLAGVVLQRINSNLILIASGGLTNIESARASPMIATVMAAELRELGVPANAILEESTAFTTWEQLLNCSKIAREHGWGSHDAGILSLFWHFGRIAAMIMQSKQQPLIAPFTTGLTPLISAERVLASEDAERWNGYFTRLYAHPDMAKTLIKEALGTGQLWSGHSPNFGGPFKGFSDPLTPNWKDISG